MGRVMVGEGNRSPLILNQKRQRQWLLFICSLLGGHGLLFLLCGTVGLGLFLCCLLLVGFW